MRHDKIKSNVSNVCTVFLEEATAEGEQSQAAAEFFFASSILPSLLVVVAGSGLLVIIARGLLLLVVVAGGLLWGWIAIVVSVPGVWRAVCVEFLLLGRVLLH